MYGKAITTPVKGPANWKRVTMCPGKVSCSIPSVDVRSFKQILGSVHNYLVCALSKLYSTIVYSYVVSDTNSPCRVDHSGLSTRTKSPRYRLTCSMAFRPRFLKCECPSPIYHNVTCRQRSVHREDSAYEHIHPYCWCYERRAATFYGRDITFSANQF